MVAPAPIRTTYTLLALSSWYDYVIPDIKSFVPAIVDMAIRDAAIEFCMRSLIWKESLDPIGLAGNVNQYDVSVPSQSALADVLDAQLANAQSWLDPISMSGVRQAGGSQRTGDPAGYLFFDDLTITIDPTPSVSDTLYLVAALKPARAAPKLPSFLMERWNDAIVAGAKARLMMMKDKPWSNLQLADMHRSSFDSKCGTAGIVSARMRSRLPLRATVVHGVK